MPYFRVVPADKEGGGLEQSFEHRRHLAGRLQKATSLSMCKDKNPIMRETIAKPAHPMCNV